MCVVYCMQVVKVVCFVVEDREELVVGKQLLVDMMMVQQVKEVFVWDLLEGLFELVEVCLVVQDVEVEVVFLLMSFVENECFLVNKQGQVEGFQEFFFDLEMLVLLVVCVGLFVVDVLFFVGQYFEEIKVFFVRFVFGFGDVGSFVCFGVVMY